MKLNYLTSIAVLVLILLTTACEDFERLTIVSETIILPPDNEQSLAIQAKAKILDISPNDVIFQAGHVWSLSPNPRVESNNKAIGLRQGNLGEFESSLDNLVRSNIYYIRAYVILENGERIYGPQTTFQTPGPLNLGEIGKGSSRAAILYGEASLITDESAQLTGEILKLPENEPVIDHGHVCSSTFDDPALQNGIFSSLGPADQLTSFTSTISGLNPSTQYFVRAYMRTESDTIYSARDILDRPRDFFTGPRN